MKDSFLSNRYCIDIYDDDFQCILLGTGIDFNLFIKNMEFLFSLFKVEKKFQHCISGIVDNSKEKQGTLVFGNKVVSSDILKDWKGQTPIVITTFKYYQDICVQLDEMGFKQYQNYILYKEFFTYVVEMALQKVDETKYLALLNDFQQETLDKDGANDFINTLRNLNIEKKVRMKFSCFFFDKYILRKYLQTYPKTSENLIRFSLKKILQEEYGYRDLYSLVDAGVYADLKKLWKKWLENAPECVKVNPFYLYLKFWIESFCLEHKNNLALTRYIENIVDIDSRLERKANIVELGANDGIVSVGLSVLGHQVLSTDIARGLLEEAELYMQVGEWIRLHMTQDIIVDIFDANNMEKCANLDIFWSSELEHKGINCIFLSGTGIFAINKPQKIQLSEIVEETFKRIMPLYNILNHGGFIYAKNEIFDFGIRDIQTQDEYFFPGLKNMLIKRLQPVKCEITKGQVGVQHGAAWQPFRHTLFLLKKKENWKM